MRTLYYAFTFAVLAAAPAPGQTPPAAPAATGLDALDEDRLYTELAERGQAKLLDRAFEINKVPPAKQAGIRALVAMRELTKPNAKLTPKQRQETIAKIVAGIEGALPSLTDPKILMQLATVLITQAHDREVNTLEYWGDNPRVQAALAPVARAISSLLAKAEAEAAKQADALANQATGLEDPRLAQSDEISRLSMGAAYTRRMADYYVALSTDKADPKRKKIADEAIEFLQAYDNDQSNVQTAVRNRMAKLHMTAGQFDEAKKLFATVAENPGGAIKPPPDLPARYEAVYFAAVADILAKKPVDARKSLERLLEWQKTNLPQDKAAQDAAGAAVAMLQYRIRALEGELASDPVSKQKANDAAVAVLVDLVKQRPELQGIVFEQLTDRLPANPALKDLNPLLLQAIVRKGEEERLKPEGQKRDAAVLERALAAARELLSRKGQPGADPQMLESASLLVPFFLMDLGRNAESVNGFVDHLDKYPAGRNAKLAMDHAMALVGQLLKQSPDDPSTVRAYERVLPIAINPPYNRTDLAYEYARRLHKLGRHKDAATYYARVPEDDKRKLNARFYELVTLQQRLDNEKLEGPARQKVVADMQGLSDEVLKRAQANLASAQSDADKQTARSLVVRTTLLAADVARREQKDANRTLKLLENFEEAVKGLPNENELLSSVLFSRVQSYMLLGRNNEATEILVKLLNTKGGGEGATIVFNLLEKLNADLERARVANDREQMRVLARNRAQLSGHLVNWAKNNADPNIKKFTYRYAVFEAATKHLVADLEEDPAARKAALAEALKLYTALQSPENVELYRSTLDGRAGADPSYPDPAVLLGTGLIAYDLGNYAEAQRQLGRLLSDRKLGTPTMTVVENGEPRTTSNDQYWEATLKLLRSNVAVAREAKDEAGMKNTQDYLKQLYIRWGAGVGGQRWNAEFEKLRAELIPDFKVEDLDAPATEPVTSATQPVVAGD